jgi:hypothetical protein
MDPIMRRAMGGRRVVEWMLLLLLLSFVMREFVGVNAETKKGEEDVVAMNARDNEDDEGTDDAVWNAELFAIRKPRDVMVVRVSIGAMTIRSRMQ